MEPADVAAKAMRLVQDNERDAWLGLFAPGALLEEPVGHAPPRRGATELAAFWDTGIAVLDEVRFDVRRLHATPLEALALVDVAVPRPTARRRATTPRSTTRSTSTARSDHYERSGISRPSWRNSPPPRPARRGGRLRLDPGDRAVAEVRGPHGTGADGDAGWVVAGRDRVSDDGAVERVDPR